MKSLIMIATLFSVLHCYAQVDMKIVPWEKFESPVEEFTVETPAAFQISGDAEPKSSRSYVARVDDTFVYVFSDPVREPRYYSTINGFLKDWGKTIAEEKPETTPKTISFDDKFGYYQRAIIIRTAARIYVAQAISKKVDDPIAKRFISSFSIGDKRLTELAATVPEALKEMGASAPSKASGVGPGAGTGSGSGSGAGSGRGSGIGSGIGGGPVVPVKPPAVESPLTILAKPHPSYTDIARFYSISGKVNLRVTFLGSGQIGSVSAIQTLPFGLTDRAIEAARRITFQPKMQDGKAVSVTRLVEYTFAIY